MVTANLKKVVPDQEHAAALKDAVLRTHLSTLHATELLNLYVRDRIENHGGTGLDGVFTQNWLLNAYYVVSKAETKRVPKVDSTLQAVFDAHMAGTFDLPSRAALVQTLNYECVNLAAVGSTNVWKHFQARVLKHTRTRFALADADYKKLSKEERRKRKLAVMQAASDLTRHPADPKRSPAEYHAWVDS